MSNVWLITGASSGLGEGIADAALNAGILVAATARDPDRLGNLMQRFPGRVFPVRLDLNDPDSIRRAVRGTLEKFGTIDVLVNNAGHGYRAAIEESEPDAVKELFQTNFFGPMELIRQVLPEMRAKKKGMIVNVTSIGAVRGALGNGYYSAAKGALELASESLAKEVRHLGIRVMLVEPGAFRTGFYGYRLEESGKKLSDYDIFANQYRKADTGNPSNQRGDPQKGGALIVRTVLEKTPPFRLLLGSDAVQAACSTLEERLREIHEWEKISGTSDF